MRCKDFDAHIDEMLSGILYPDANQHMRQCERCTSHFRSRTLVQNGLRQLASAALSGPSRATDRAVMDGYRRLQQRRAVAGSGVPSLPSTQNAAKSARLFTFPSGGPAPARASRNWMTHAAAAAVVFAVLGSAAHLWHGVPTVNAPTVATAPLASAPAPAAPEQPASALTAQPAVVAVNMAPRHSRPVHPFSRPSSSQFNATQSATPSDTASLRLASINSPELTADQNTSSQLPANSASIVHLASAGNVSSMAQSASSTWPGYSNLMYCDPVVCSGPMQVVHIKVPVGQVNPSLGQTVGNGFVNAEVVIGPDGVARAIRVAN